MTSAHTPTPWALYTIPIRYGTAVIRMIGNPKPEGGYEAVCRIETSNPNRKDANAALIVRAVNSHAEMLAALQSVRGWIEHWKDDVADGQWPTLASLKAAKAEIEAALSRASSPSE